MKHSDFVPIIGLLLVVVGICLCWGINSQKFDRRNFTGVEQFPNYANKEVTRFTEGIGKLVGWVFILAGTGLMLA